MCITPRLPVEQLGAPRRSRCGRLKLRASLSRVFHTKQRCGLSRLPGFQAAKKNHRDKKRCGLKDDARERTRDARQEEPATPAQTKNQRHATPASLCIYRPVPRGVSCIGTCAGAPTCSTGVMRCIQQTDCTRDGTFRIFLTQRAVLCVISIRPKMAEDKI